MPFTVRAATPADAAGMGLVNVLAWQVGYVGLFPPEYLAGRDPAARAEFWRNDLAAADPRRRNVVAVEEDGSRAGPGDVVGFASFGRVQITDGDDWTGEPEPGVGELTVINVRPDRWSRGVGGALLAAVDAGLAAMGYREQVLWVLTGNTRARRWYEHRGWHPDGGTLHAVYDGVVFDQVRYRKATGGPAA